MERMRCFVSVEFEPKVYLSLGCYGTAVEASPGKCRRPVHSSMASEGMALFGVSPGHSGGEACLAHCRIPSSWPGVFSNSVNV